MKFKNPLLVVSDMEKSIEFYKNTLGLKVIMDLGANVTLTGGICLQTKESWMDFVDFGGTEIIFGSNSSEIYFEEDDFAAFIRKLSAIEGINYVHRPLEHSWGQKVVRFYDPDKQIIEVGESLRTVCRRFWDKGMSIMEISKRMDIPVKFVNGLMRGK
ncbi:MAG: VOC family protein [Firmicutes bacterium]|nr:VOC family protein [Bacillota bacterium]